MHKDGFSKARYAGHTEQRLLHRICAIKGVAFGLLAVVLCVIPALIPTSAMAEPLCTDTWTGPAEGEWTTAVNWSTGKVPSSTDVACIGAENAVNITAEANQAGVLEDKGSLVMSAGSLEITNALEASTVHNLTIADVAERTGGVLTGAAEVDVTGSFVAGRYGTLSGSGSTVIESGATGTVLTQMYLEGRTLKNAGTLTVGRTAYIQASGHSRLINSGTLIVNGEAGNGLLASSTESTLINTGTFKKTEGASAAVIGFAIDNEGTVSTTSGKLEFTGGGISGEHSTGSWSASGSETGIVLNQNGGTFVLGATVPIAGSFEVVDGLVTAGKIEGSTASVTLTGFGSLAGTLEVTGATASTFQNLTIEDIGGERNGGVLTGAGEVDVTGSFVGVKWGTMTGTGSTVIEPGATGSITSQMYLEGRALKNAGTLTVGKTAYILGGKHARLINSGTLIINGQGGDGLEAGENEATLVNTGTLKKTEGTWETQIHFETENLGAIKEEAGYFKFFYPIIARGPSTQYGGPENPSAPGEVQSGCGDPVSCATGNFSETQTDFTIGGRGVGLDLTRTYNSRAGAENVKGIFGYGWSSSFEDHLVVNKASKIATLHQASGATVPFTEGSGESFTVPGWSQDMLSGSEGLGYTLTLADQVKYKFAGSSGRLESVTDRDGNATALTYNEAGQLTTITDPVSRTIKLAYNGEGLVESAEDPMKHVVKYAYEGGNLKSVTQPGEEGWRWQFKYNGEHELSELTDGRAGKTLNEYNGSNQVTKQEDPAGHKLKFEYETFQTKITNENTGSVTDEYFTSNDEPASITRGYGTASATTEAFTYNEGGYVTGVTDGNGHTTTYGYSAANDRTSMVDPNKNETKWTYDATHDVETMTTPKGETTTIKREAHGNPETIERPAPESKTQITKYKYKTTGELESVEDPLKRVWKYEYDTHGNRMAEVDPLTDKRTWEYNEDSQEIATVSPRGNVTGGEPSKFTTKIERDNQGRPLKITDPLSHTTKYTYDGDGNVATTTDGNSHTTTYTYNGDNQPIKVEAPNKAITETEYDGAGQVVSQTDGNKNITKYKRNPVEEVTEVTDPLGRITKKEYDAAGNLKTLEDPAKRTTTYKYDPANRLEEVSYSDGTTPTVKYEYDADGDRTKMVDGTGTTKYAYDQLDRLTESENGHKEVSKYEYDLANQQTKITYPNTKSVTRAFDKAGRLEKVTDWSSNVVKFTYNVDSAQVTTLFPSATKDEDKYAYNNANQMTEAKMLKSAETLASLVYTRDNDGQVKKTTSKSLPGAEITENTYDVNNRLTKSGSEYKYDSANNATTIGAGTYKYDKGSELETGPSLTYTYNELGERTKTKPTVGPATTYGYDQAGNLTSVERPKEGEVSEIKDTYAYDGNGLRASQTISGTTTHLAWDMTAGLPLILSDETNSYIYGPGGLPVEQVSSGGTITYLHHDQQGSTRLLTGVAGTVTGSTTFDGYGNKTGSTGTSTTPLGYDGQYTSTDTGLIYMRARVYDPATAQFLSGDPALAITRAPYNYTYDNPLNAVDPAGLLPSLEDISNASAGALDFLTFGGSTKLAGEVFGFNADCANFGTAGEIGAVLGVGLGLFDGETEALIGAEGADQAAALAKALQGGERAPELSSPFATQTILDSAGNIKQVTTYDEYGRRAYQYDLGPSTRHGEGYHAFEYGPGRERGGRGEHMPF